MSLFHSGKDVSIILNLLFRQQQLFIKNLRGEILEICSSGFRNTKCMSHLSRSFVSLRTLLREFFNQLVQFLHPPLNVQITLLLHFLCTEKSNVTEQMKGEDKMWEYADTSGPYAFGVWPFSLKDLNRDVKCRLSSLIQEVYKNACDCLMVKCNICYSLTVLYLWTRRHTVTRSNDLFNPCIKAVC